MPSVVAQVNYPRLKVAVETGSGSTVVAAANPYLGPATNLHLEFPLFSRPGVGGAQFSATLVYDSQFWGTAPGRWYPQAGNGWWLRTPGGQVSEADNADYGACGWTDGDGTDDGSGEIDYYTVTFTEPDGTVANGPSFMVVYGPYGLHDEGYYSDCPPSDPLPISTVINDGKGFTVTVDGSGSATAWDGAGNDLSSGLADRNGNSVRLSGASYVDPLGTALTVGGSPSSSVTYQYPGPGGVPETITVAYESVNATGSFGCYGGWSGTLRVPASIQYPDGSTYTFTYDSAGRVASMTKPTGGTISYSYTLGVQCSPFYISDSLTESDSINGPNVYWQWIHTTSDNQTVQTDPYGGRVTTTFDSSGNPAQVDAGNTYNGPIVTRTISSGTVYNRTSIVELCASQTDPCGATDKAMLQSSHSIVLDEEGNVASTQDTDWGVDAPGALLRRTVNTYQASGNGEVLTSAEVEDANSNQAALTQFTSFDGSGNPLTRVDWAATGGASLTTRYAYNANGTLQSVTAPNGGVTSFSNFACSNAFPQTVTTAIGSTSLSWDCFGGRETGSIGLNNEQTAATFNSMWQPTSVTAPNGAVTSFLYPNVSMVERVLSFNGGNSSQDLYTESDALGRPFLQQTRQSPGTGTGGTFDTVQTTYDAMGRVASVSRPYAGAFGATAPSGIKFTTTTYDAMSRPVKVVDGGGGETDVSYPLNDVLTTVVGSGSAPTVARQQEMDGLGRLISVCEVTAGTSTWPAGSCNQRSAASGYLTAYTRDTLGDLTSVAQDSQPGNAGVEHRSFSFDQLGRMTSESNPETGTVAYTLDSDGTCGSGAADLGS
ncbi:MAG TPA: RHS repeat domain-containing protein, partial [Terriglobales bacterium]|nr:RHS repeat domain-containing protein [Terriglobales bacterium]